MLDGMEECFGPNRVGDRFTNPRARIIPAPKSIDHSHKRRIVPLHLNPGMSPGFLFESFPANTHGGQQMPSKLYVGNLAYSVTNDDLQALFSQVGKVASAAVVSDKFSGQSRGFGFVEMESSGDAAKAISEFDGKDLKGHNLKVNEAKPREFGGGGGGGGRDNRGAGGRGGNRW